MMMIRIPSFLFSVLTIVTACVNESKKEHQLFYFGNDALVTDDTALISINLNETDSIEFAVPERKGKVLYNSAYCNGAPPPEEILEDLRKYRALTNSEIKFVYQNDNSNIVYLKTDENGNLTGHLENGKWDYYLTPNISKKHGIDPTCELRFEEAYGTIEIKETLKKIPDLHFYFDCDACDPTLKMRP